MNADEREAALALAREWAQETRAVLTTCVRLAEYFGSEEEWRSLKRALGPVWDWIRSVETGISSDVALPYADFTCGRELAAILSPLLQLLVEPIPEFVAIARGLPEAERKLLVVPFGVFSGTMARHVCKHMWREFHDLAPEGWLL